ncbi:hypothetical protein J3F83DRAFT_320128 [Trichoderma novae-zelandiae]
MAPHQRLRMAASLRPLSPCRASLRRSCITGLSRSSVAGARRLPPVSGSHRGLATATLCPSAPAPGPVSTNPSPGSVRVGRHISAASASVTIPSSLSPFSPSSPLPSPLLSTGRLPSILQQQRSFTTTAAAMVATKLDGNSIAKAIRERLGAEIAEKQKKNPRYRPSLRIIQDYSSYLHPPQSLWNGAKIV